MKQWKKFMLVFMCTGIMMGLTACGNNTDDNAANDNSATEGTTGTDDTVKDDVTDRNNENDGVMDEIGDDVQDGVDDIEDDLDPNDRKMKRIRIMTEQQTRTGITLIKTIRKTQNNR